MSAQRSSTVTLIATVLNEYGSLPGWLAALERQWRLPDECIIVDGGSDDGTWELLQGWRPGFALTLAQLPGSSISSGRNHALMQASGDIVAITDAGTVADQHWLEALVTALESDEQADVAAGFFQPRERGTWSRTLGAVTLPVATEIEPDRFQPSSRSVAIRRSWFEMGFLYPEWLDYCEDLVLDLQLQRAGARFVFVPDATVWFDPRRSWQAFFRQYFRYARGDGKAGLFWRRHLVRYLAYSCMVAVLFRWRIREIAALVAFGTLYLLRPAERLLKRDRASGREPAWTLAALPLLPLHMIVGDAAKMTGYPLGLVWRTRRWGLRALGTTGWWCVRFDGVRWRP